MKVKKGSAVLAWLEPVGARDVSLQLEIIPSHIVQSRIQDLQSRFLKAWGYSIVSVDKGRRGRYTMQLLPLQLSLELF